MKKSRSRRWLLALLAVGLVTATVLLATWGGPAVGHFASTADQDRYMHAYARAMAELPPPQQVLDVRTTFGVVRAYRFRGTADDRPPLLLLPGRASAAPVWADNLPGLLQHRSVYLLDLLGEPGMSAQSTPMRDDADQAAWLRQFLDQLPEPRVHVVGLSIGGWTAANLAVHGSAKIASLVLVEPVLVFAGLAPAAVLRSIPASVPWLPGRFRDDFARWTAGGADTEGAAVADLIEAGMQGYRLGVPVPGRLDAAAVGRIDVPVLVILAGNSPMHDTAAAAAEAHRLLPHARVEVYPGASHALNGEQPARLTADIAAHLADAEKP